MRDLVLPTVFLLATCVLLTAPLLHAEDGAVAAPVPTALNKYVERAEPVFKWQKLNSARSAAGTVTNLRVTSQTWHGIVWEHAVEIYEPTTLSSPNHAILYVTGGKQPPQRPGHDDMTMGFGLAAASGMRVIMLHQVPNQPLFDNRVEDDLITETWLNYLKDGDETWPLLFPMVKSAVKTMDAVQELSKQEYDQPITKFIITGASKRGWTSWLTPVADKRVVATAPIVIDVLNFQAQMQHQLDTWGKYSDQINDYSSKGLIVLKNESDRERQLRTMMDPWTYRSQLTLPKLLVIGTNDPYWVVDAMQIYWNDLKGPKWALQIPNAGHGLEGGRDKAMSSIGAFARMTASGQHIPKLTWSFSRSDTARTLDVISSHPAKSARLWSAQSQDLDFRDDRWTAVAMDQAGDEWTATVTSPDNVAVYAELIFTVDDVPYSLCSTVFRD